MKSKHIGLLLLFLLISLNLGLSGYYYAKLPPRVASEFDLSGDPKSWMAKGTFVVFNFTLMALLPIFLLVVGWLSMKLPASMINLPNKDYWLAPERRAATNASVFRLMLSMACGVELFLTFLVWTVYRANTGHPEIMRQMPLYLTGCFLTFVAVWIVCFYRKFRKVPAE
jgi:uncharacterized membrane protein